MICHVVINDFVMGRRMRYLLDDIDFANEISCDWKDESAQLLQFHLMIVDTINSLDKLSDAECAQQTHPLVVTLTKLLCGFVQLIQHAAMIELLRVNRINKDTVTYDYTSTLELSYDN